MSNMLETQPLIHIGLHKTASTWLQNEVFLNNTGSFIPLGGTPKKAGRLFVWNGNDGPMLAPYSKNHIKHLQELLVNTDIPSSSVPVISNERLSGNPHAGLFDSPVIAKRLHDVFPDARIFIVIREQRSMIASSYLQYLKRGGTHDIDNYISCGYDGAIPKFTPESLCYDGLIKYYQDLFGTDNVLILPYEMLSTDSSNFVHSLYRFAGINKYPEVNAKKRHNSPDARLRAARIMLRKLNAFRVSTSLNNHSGLALPGVRNLASIAQNTTAFLLPKTVAQKRIEKMRERVNTLVEGLYTQSNTETSRLIGIKLQDTYGYM